MSSLSPLSTRPGQQCQCLGKCLLVAGSNAPLHLKRPQPKLQAPSSLPLKKAIVPSALCSYFQLNRGQRPRAVWEKMSKWKRRPYFASAGYCLSGYRNTDTTVGPALMLGPPFLYHHLFTWADVLSAQMCSNNCASCEKIFSQFGMDSWILASPCCSLLVDPCPAAHTVPLQPTL